MKGGARSRSGPPPRPGSTRNGRDLDGWTTLPAAGREGEAPTWPLTRPKARELKLWAELWRKPQAIEWERLGQEHEVGLYVRAFVELEAPGASADRRRLLRQMAEDLGLTMPGMLRLRWRIGSADAPADWRRPTGTDGKTSAADVRRRFRVVT